jgi:hypothetical protein
MSTVGSSRSGHSLMSNQVHLILTPARGMVWGRAVGAAHRYCTNSRSGAKAGRELSRISSLMTLSKANWAPTLQELLRSRLFEGKVYHS